jgi:uncharacterized protein DUF2628
MKLYTAHRPPNFSRDHTVFVKEGFSWPAFFFPPIWLLYQRLWLAFALYVLAVAAISTGASAAGLPGGPVTVLILALNLILGFEANDMRRSALLRRGYSEEGPLLGENLLHAETRYFGPRLAHGAPAATPDA